MPDAWMRRQQDRAYRLQAEVLERATPVLTVLGGPDGEAFLTWLEDRFYHTDLVGERPEETYFHLGEREVVRILRNIRRAARSAAERKP